MRRISNTIELAKASWNVLQADKELMILPLLSAVATIIVAVGFVIPVFAYGAFDAEQLTITDYAILLAFYIVAAFVTIFFNAALVHAANERLQGGGLRWAAPVVGSDASCPGRSSLERCRSCCGSSRIGSEVSVGSSSASLGLPGRW